MDSAVKRPWYRLHWVTWVVLAVVMAALVYRELEPTRFDGGHFLTKSGRISFSEVEFGWPFPYSVRWESEVSSFQYSFPWQMQIVTIDAIFCCLVASCTARVVEGWLRSSAMWRVSLRSMMGTTFLIAVLLALAVQHEAIAGIMTPWGGPSTRFVSWNEFMRPVRWPVLFGVACTIYSLGWLALALLRRAYRLVRR
jgi:hypothetical protein